MGYTHYFTFKRPNKGEAQNTEALFQKAVRECAKIARAWNDMHPKGSVDDDMRLSGYTAHVKRIQLYGGLEINGKGDNAHETFAVREHYSQNVEQAGDFCKTARKPYDTVVTACLSVLKYRLGDLIDVRSDGDAEDWQAGVDLARKVLKRAVSNPLTVEDAEQDEFNS